MFTRIVDRGRGPEIEGTRITVFDVMDYLAAGWSADRIAPLFCVLPEQVQAAIDYVQQHRVELEPEYQQIIERHRNYQYPPEVTQKLAASRAAFAALVAQIRSQTSAEAANAMPHGR